MNARRRCSCNARRASPQLGPNVEDVNESDENRKCQNTRPHIVDAGEGQQQELRVSFGGIYRYVRAALSKQIGTLGRLYLQSNKDPAIKAEIDRLNAELAKMPARWVFHGR